MVCVCVQVHLSFSLYEDEKKDKSAASGFHSDVLNLFLQSVGIVLTDINDVIFKSVHLHG